VSLPVVVLIILLDLSNLVLPMSADFSSELASLRNKFMILSTIRSLYVLSSTNLDDQLIYLTKKYKQLT
jgi:hypothetical protein